MDNASFREIYALVQDWARRTDAAEKEAYKRMGIGDTGATLQTINSTVLANGDQVVVEHSFATVGRFRDMGAGPGSPGYSGRQAPSIELAVSKVENKQRNAERIRQSNDSKTRQPKKFYSVTFYGRINALMGAVSGKMQETAVSLVQEKLQDEKE